MTGKLKKNKEDFSATDIVSDIDQVTKLLNKPKEDDSDGYFCKTLLGRLKSLPPKKNQADTHKNRGNFIQLGVCIKPNHKN